MESGQLFDYVVIVKLQEGPNGVTPFIDYQFPPAEEKVDDTPFINSIAQFCFPDPDAFPAKDIETELFTFVLTDNAGERRNGYCKHVLPPGTDKRMPICFCLVSFVPCIKLFAAVLDEVASRYEHSLGSSSIFQFLKSVLAHPLPEPGQTFVVRAFTKDGQRKELQFTRPDDSDYQLGRFNIEPLFLSLSPVAILTVYAALLVERRMIFSSASVSVLSSCVQTCLAFLYPFVWQHIFIPVLPKSMLSFCCAPMPFVVGVMESCLPEVAKLPMDEVFIVDLDDNEFIRRPYNELKLLPSHIATPLLKTFSSICKYVKKKRKAVETGAPLPEAMNIKKVLSDGLIAFNIGLLASYRDFIKDDEFDREGFLEANSNSRKFLELLVGSQLFETFIAERIKSKKSSAWHGKFEKRLTMWIDTAAESGFDVPSHSSSKTNDEWDLMVEKFLQEQSEKQLQQQPKEGKRKWKDMVLTSLEKAKAKAKQSLGSSAQHDHAGVGFWESQPLLAVLDPQRSPNISRRQSPTADRSPSPSPLHLPAPPKLPTINPPKSSSSTSGKSRSKIRLKKNTQLKDQLADVRLRSTSSPLGAQGRSASNDSTLGRTSPTSETTQKSLALPGLSNKVKVRSNIRKKNLGEKRPYASDTRIDVRSIQQNYKSNVMTEKPSHCLDSDTQGSRPPNKPQPPLPHSPFQTRASAKPSPTVPVKSSKPPAAPPPATPLSRTFTPTKASSNPPSVIHSNLAPKAKAKPKPPPASNKPKQLSSSPVSDRTPSASVPKAKAKPHNKFMKPTSQPLMAASKPTSKPKLSSKPSPNNISSPLVKPAPKGRSLPKPPSSGAVVTRKASSDALPPSSPALGRSPCVHPKLKKKPSPKGKSQAARSNSLAMRPLPKPKV